MGWGSLRASKQGRERGKRGEYESQGMGEPESEQARRLCCGYRGCEEASLRVSVSRASCVKEGEGGGRQWRSYYHHEHKRDEVAF